MSSIDSLLASQLADVIRMFRSYKALGDAALRNTPDEHLHTELDANSNSIAIIVKHLAGNLRSRYRDFLTDRRRKAGSRSGPRVRNARAGFASGDRAMVE
jgi:hypothetical protein